MRVGDPLVLHAERTSGPWVAVDRATLTADACWWTSAVEHEEDVAGNLRWTAEPSGPARFNLDLRTDGSREVRFSEPGVYALTPESSGWCGDPYPGNVLRVVVTPR